MRSLAADGYTAAEVEAQLTATSCRYAARFEVLESDLRHAGDLDGVVHAASVDFEAERAIKGSLDLELTPDPAMAGDLFRMRIKPWFGPVMPDGGVAWHPLGVYVWTVPDRRLGGVDAETWSVNLPDQGWMLEMGGPGAQAFRLDIGDRYTGGIRQLLRRAGLSDTSGVVRSDDELEEMLSWSRRRNIEFRVTPRGRWNVKVDTTPETWRTIAEDLTDAIGYDQIWFDAEGRARATPSVDLASASSDHTYTTDDRSIIIGDLDVTHDLSRVANRVFARSKHKRRDHANVGVADLNDLIPRHPLAERNIGTYIDIDIDLPAGHGARGLNAKARQHLYRRLSALEEIDFTTLAWPVHEAYELIGLAYTGDPEFDHGAKFHEAGWGLTLVTQGDGLGTMTHRLRRLTGVTRL